MRRILRWLIGVGIVLLIAWWLAGLRGRLTAQFGDYTVDVSNTTAFLVLLILFAIAYVIVRVLRAMFRVHHYHAAWRAGRNRHAGEQAVTRALVALAAGEKSDARREAARARQLLGDTPQTLLLTAESSRLAGRDDEAHTALTALAAREDAAFLGLRGLLAAAVTRQDWAEAAAIARRAEAAHPGAAWLRQERTQLAIRAGNWAEALTLSGKDGPSAALAVGASQGEADADLAEKYARQAVRQDPGFVPGILAYATRLRARGKEKRALAVLAEGWTRVPHPEIAALALAPLTDPLARAAAAQRLTQGTPDHPETHLLLARRALDANLLAEARRHLDALKRSGCDQRRMWLLIAELEEEDRGGTEEGRTAQRDALRRVSDAAPDPEWRCETCRTPQPVWRPACPVCQTPGSLRWDSGGPAVAGTAMITRAA